MARRLTLLAAAALGCCGGPVPTWAQQTAMPLAWEPVPAAEVIDPARELAAAEGEAQPPASAEEVQALLKTLIPNADDYLPMLRLGQLPTGGLLPEGSLQLNAQQVSPGDGGAAGGSGNQNYGFRADLMLGRNWMVSGFFTYADDPLYATITVRPSQPANLWMVWGGSLKTRLAESKNWSLAAEGSLELFSVGSGCSSPGSCSGSDVGNDNIFNNSGQDVYTNNLVGSLSLPLSWQANRQLELSFVPSVSFLPDSQGNNQGGKGTFFGTNVSLGFGANYRIGNQVQLFGSAMLPLGPGSNAFDSALNFSRVPILTAGTNIALNPRIGLEATITNGFGLSPATAILALPSAPKEPMLGARLVWTPTAPDSPIANFTTRQASLALGGLMVNTALTPEDGTTQLWLNADSGGNIWGAAGYSASNDLQFQIITGAFNNIQPINSYVSTFAGDGGLNLRFGAKAMLFRATNKIPIWFGGRVTAGRANLESTVDGVRQGYLFSELMGTWEATSKLAFNINPKLAWSGSGTSWGIGLGANLQIAERLQLIPELNLVATDLGGQNGSNGSLALRWLATRTTSMDLYVSNGVGLVDLGQLLRNDQVRVGMKLSLQF